MDSLIFIITMIFLVAGIGFGLGAKTITSSVDVINGITKTFAGLAGLVFLLLLISQFIAYFNFTNMPTVAAVKMADVLEQADIGALLAADRVHPRDRAARHHHPRRRARSGPSSPPSSSRCSCGSTWRPRPCWPPTGVGDSPVNVITPLMVYLPFIVIVAQRYKKDAGIGTIISLMIPYTVDRPGDLDRSSSSSGSCWASPSAPIRPSSSEPSAAARRPRPALLRSARRTARGRRRRRRTRPSSGSPSFQ